MLREVRPTPSPGSLRSPPLRGEGRKMNKPALSRKEGIEKGRPSDRGGESKNQVDNSPLLQGEGGPQSGG